MKEGIKARLDAVLDIISDAGALAMRSFHRDPSLGMAFKGHQDQVTAADLAVETLVIARLRAAFPDDSFLGEESGGVSKDRVWVIDPIDGTANFARGIPHFGISIAFVADGEVQIGVVHAPALSETFWATRGGGAWLNGRAIAVSSTDDFRRAHIEIGWNLKDRVEAFTTTIRNVASRGGAMIRAGSAALALAYVAAGRLDGYCEQHVFVWDALAGVLLVAEAGGRTNAFFLDASGWREGGAIIAANGQVFDILSECAAIR